MAVLPPDPVFVLQTQNVGLIHCLCFPPPFNPTIDSAPTHLLAGTESGILYIWNLQNNRLQHQFEVGPSLLSIQHTEENTLITQEKTGEIKIWQRENECIYKKIASISAGLGFCRTILIDNKRIAASNSDSIMEIYDISTQKRISTFNPKKLSKAKLGQLMCINHFKLNDNSYILTGYESGDLILWDLSETTKYLSQLKLRECIVSVDYDTTNNRGVAGNSTNILEVFNIARDTFELSLKVELKMTNAGCNTVKIRPDRKVFVSGGWDGYLRIYSWKSLRPLAVLTEHKGAISDVVFSNKPVVSWNTNLMAAAGQDGRISLWNLYN